MFNTQQVNDAFTPFRERPVSHLAALAVLAALAFIAHAGIVAWVPGALGVALSVLFLAVAVLQWLGLGRHEACAADGKRADAVITQAWIFGGIETVLYALGGLALLAKEGLAVYAWPFVAIAMAAGAAAALINFRIKWVSCDPVKAARTAPSNGGQRVHDVLFNAPALDAPSAQDASAEIVHFDLERAIREKTARMEAAEAAALAAAPPARTAKVRLRNAAKRIRVRAGRAAEKQAVAA